MTMPILKMTTPIPDKVVNDPKFRLMLETHRGYFKQEGNFDVHTVNEHAAFKYRYDLHGYLISQNIHPELHFAIMRINDIESPTHFDRTRELLIIPKGEVYAKLKGLYSTSLGKVGKN